MSRCRTALSVAPSSIRALALLGSLVGCRPSGAEGSAERSLAAGEATGVETVLGLPAAAGRVLAVDALRGSQWNMDVLAAEQAWPWSTGEGVVVAVIDTGVFADGSETARTSDIIAGIDYAVSEGADVINMSLGIPAGMNRAIAGLQPTVCSPPPRSTSATRVTTSPSGTASSSRPPPSKS